MVLELNRRKVIGGMAAGGVLAGFPAWAKQGKRPNILFIMADDLGFADLSCYGFGIYQTPNLDRLARRGVRFTNAYANSCVCSPTRTALLTGCYQGRFPIGLEEPVALNGDELSIPRDRTTIAQLFRSRGYRTSLIGKWHLGEPPAGSPLHYGYDSFFGIHSGGTDYFAHETTLLGKRMGALYEGLHPVTRNGYLTDLFADRAVEEIAAARKAEAPFFMSLHFTSPHWPWQGPDDAASGSAERDPRDADRGSVAKYGEMIANLDANIGRVLGELDGRGMTDDTIIVFTSDNGGERFSNMWPLTGMKGELMEGGIRVPLIISHPGTVPSERVSDQVAITMDMMPTLHAMSGGDPATLPRVDGMDIHAALAPSASVTERTLFWRHKAGNQAAMRQGQWKYLRMYGQEHLFDLSADERERADKKGHEPERLKTMQQAFSAWESTMLRYPGNSFSEGTKGKYADRP